MRLRRWTHKHLALGGAPVYCMAWSNCFHAVAVCSFSPYAPIRVLCYSSDEHAVQLNPQNKEAAAAKKQKPQRVSQVSVPHSCSGMSTSGNDC